MNAPRRSSTQPLNGDSFVVGETLTYSVSAVDPIVSDLQVTITPTNPANVNVNPTTLNYVAGSLSQTFNVTGLVVGQTTINFAVSGTDTAYTNTPFPLTATVTILPRNDFS